MLVVNSCTYNSRPLKLGDYMKCEGNELIFINSSQMACHQRAIIANVLYDLGIINDTIVYFSTSDKTFSLENQIKIGDSYLKSCSILDTSNSYVDASQGVVVPHGEWNVVFNSDEIDKMCVTHFMKR